jgi:uncharacterized protein YprB with RNaseH-like and TPR domain
MFEQNSEITQGKNYILVDTPKKFSWLVKTLSASSIISFDTETTGLDWKSDKVIGASFSWEKNSAALER